MLQDRIVYKTTKTSPSVCPDKTIDNSPTDLNGIEAGKTVSVTCTDNNFELKGSNMVTCHNNISWSDLPTCEKKGTIIHSYDRIFFPKKSKH